MPTPYHRNPVGACVTLVCASAILLVPSVAAAQSASPTVTECSTTNWGELCVTVTLSVDCCGWRVVSLDPIVNPSFPEAEVSIYDLYAVPESGAWTDPSVQETATFVVEADGMEWWAGFTWGTTISYSIDEPAGCAGCGGCAIIPRYYRYTRQDSEQPAGWAPYCYIISNVGPPSVEAQARVCTVPGFEHTYRATNVPYAGWVYADCLGRASYGWPAWDPAWYRGKWGIGK
jgi:hypothetical protein